MERAAFVAEEELCGTAVHLHPIDFCLVGDSRFGDAGNEVGDAHGLQVEKVGDLLDVGGDVVILALGEAHGDEVGGHVLGAARAKDLVAAVLDEGELARVEDHANLGTEGATRGSEKGEREVREREARGSMETE